MLHLDSLNKSVIRLGIIFFLIISVQSCRKEIIHEPSSKVAEINWLKVPGSSSNPAHCIEHFNNTLYFGVQAPSYLLGNFSMLDEQGTLNYVSNGDEFSAISTGSETAKIYALKAIGNELYLSGNFDFDNADIHARNTLIYRANGTFDSIPFSKHWSNDILHINEFNGDILYSGKFNVINNTNVSSNNIDRLQNGTSIGFADLVGTIRETLVYNNDLYAVGDDEKLQKWNEASSSWIDINYNDYNLGDKIYSLTEYNSELYIYGQFSSDVIIKKLDSQNVWSDLTEFTDSNPYINGGLKTLDGDLFLFGRAPLFNGEYNNKHNVFKFDGSTWSPVGTVSYIGYNNSVNDVALFNNKLYKATNDGIHYFQF